MRDDRKTGAHTPPAEQAEPQKQSMGRAAPKTLRQKPQRMRKRLSKRLQFLIAAICAALLLAAVAFFLGPGEESVYEANLEKALAAVENADWDRALRHLRLAAACDETDEVLLLMATCYEKQGNLDKALELLRRADAGSAGTAQRIRSIEERKAALKTAERVDVLGMLLPRDSTELELNGRGLHSEDLIQITSLYALDSLQLADNELRDISALSALGSLDSLDLSGNQITELAPLGSLTELRQLILDGNPITDLSTLATLGNLRMLSLRGCGLSAEALLELADTLPACAILSETANAEGWEIRLGGLCFPSDVRELNLSRRGIRDISALALCKELQWLNLSGNAITELQGLMNLPRLASLDISDNQVVDLRPLIGISSLRNLKAANNAILDISPLSAMTWLQTLDLSGNEIDDFSCLRRLTSLSSLRLNATGLQDADLDYLGELKQLAQLSIDENIGLSNEAFGLLQSRLRGCDISHSTLVYTIQIENRSVRSDVMQLDLSGEGITDLSGLERLNCLESLNLSRNRLSNLYQFQYSASRSSLKNLDLSFNEIRDLSPIGDLSALESLNLYANPLDSIHPLLRLSKLKLLRIGGCGLSDQQLQELQDALPDCTITLEAG